MIRILCADISSADHAVYCRLYEQANPERQRRADRYRKQEDKLRCVTADALLKYAYGRSDYQVGTRANGKPYIKDRADFFYNLSHSGHYVVITWGGSEVGVDVQQHRETNIETIARQFFTPAEQAYVQNDLQRFYEVWTKKESCLKYTGKGLQGGLASFCTLHPEPEIRYHHEILEGQYTLSLCSNEDSCTVTVVDVRQLL